MIKNLKILKVFTDGGARGNPGPAALGVFISDGDGNPVAEIGKRLGDQTNNFAEYSAIVEGLNWVLSNKEKFPFLSEVLFFMDSNLAVSQLNGLYKIKNSQLRNFVISIKIKETELGLPVSYSHVPREQNKKADRMVNLALDNKI